MNKELFSTCWREIQNGIELMQLQQPWFVQDLDLEAQQQWDSCAVRTCCWRFLLFLAIFVHPDHTHSSSMTNTREGTYHHRHHHHHPCEEMRIWDYRSFLQRWWVESVFKQIQSYSAAIAFPSEESWGFRVNFCCFSTHKILLRQYLLFMRASITDFSFEYECPQFDLHWMWSSPSRAESLASEQCILDPNNSICRQLEWQ